MKVQILVDNPNSWIVPYAQQLNQLLIEKGCDSTLIHKHEQVVKGDILLLLSCESIFKNLSFNKHNLVVHESALPKGKGWSPLTWQILEGTTEIPITLFEAAESVDSGVIYEQAYIQFEGHELLEELKHKQGETTIELILNFIEKYPKIEGKSQQGEDSFYPKRTAKDSQLNTDKTLKELFNQLRVCDNERYPAFFELNGHKYYLVISKHD